MGRAATSDPGGDAPGRHDAGLMRGLPASTARCDTSHVRGWFGHRGGDGPARLDDELAGLGRPLTVADRSCCCAARPAVTVIMPPAPGRLHPVDLLLCGRHYRAGRAALRAAGATAYDEAGVPVMTGGSEQPAARSEPAAAARGRPAPLRPDRGSRPVGCVPAGCSVTAVRRCRAARFPRPRTACSPCGAPRPRWLSCGTAAVVITAPAARPASGQDDQSRWG